METFIMKRMILGLVAFGLLGATPLLAQHPVAQPPAPVVLPAPADCVAPTCDTGGHGHGHHKWTCVPECYIKETKKWVYSSGTEPVCPGYFGHCHLFNHGCTDNACPDGKCAHAFCCHYLVKKPRICAEEKIKCVGQPRCCAGGVCTVDQGVVAVPGATVIVLPGTTTAEPIPAPRKQ
jgi:hypothetical protein